MSLEKQFYCKIRKWTSFIDIPDDLQREIIETQKLKKYKLMIRVSQKIQKLINSV